MILFDLSTSEEEHKLHQRIIKCLCKRSQIPIMAGGRIEELMDMETLMNMGCARVFLNMSERRKPRTPALAEKQFGKKHIAVCINDFTFPARKR